MMIRLTTLILCVSFLIHSTISAQNIHLDGCFYDWTQSLLGAEDYDDHDPGALGIDRLWVSSDADYIYVRFDLTDEIDLQDYNELGLHIDADNDSQTGYSINGIGAELSYYFGLQSGWLNIENGPFFIKHYDLRLYASPSVTSSSFEIAIERDIRMGDDEVIFADQIQVFLENDDTSSDKIPNGPGGISHTLNNQPNAPAYDLEKSNPDHMRLLSYNVRNDGLFGANQIDQRNIIKAANPDIIAFQEIYDNTLSQVQDILEDLFPGTNWTGRTAGPDLMTFTKHEMIGVDFIDGNSAFLIEFGPTNEPIVLINAHLPCCENDDQRQAEIDNILKHIRDAQNNNLLFDVPANTPIIIAGDLNLVGSSQNLNSLLTGDIVDEATFGEDIAPDWDGTPLENAKPLATGTPLGISWINNTSNFLPGALDYILYSRSVIELVNSFAFYTQGMDQSLLESLALTKASSTNASDHLALVADFNLGIPAITPLLATAEITKEIICPEVEFAEISVNATGGVPPYYYSVDNIEFQMSNTFQNLSPGLYSVHVLDSNGSLFDIGVMTIDSPDPLSAEVVLNGDQLEITASGGTGNLSYSIDGNNFQSSNIFTVVTNGDIEVSIRDENQCLIVVDFVVNIDSDNDGFNSDEDCDDNDAAVNPDATEIANNNIDEDCDGVIFIIDEDGDGFNSDEDCDDNNMAINPNAIEIPNNSIDEDCDGIAQIIDLDGDGFNSDEDCDDNNAEANPDQIEIPNNNVDEDCDGVILIIDVDGDGFNSDEDCDDNDPTINPAATEIPDNGIDEDCNGFDGVTDADGDGFDSTEDCNDSNAAINPDAIEIPNNNVDENCDGIILIIDEDDDGFNSDEDCDDNNPNINPDAIEIANNNIDEDCDGIALIIDLDNDGFNSDEDCDDNNASINPNATEIVNNNIDEDCDGIAQMVDNDGDGFNSDEDCDDNNPNINPDATEIANNNIDEDCDGNVLIIDEDGDGFNSDEDCDDNNAGINPDAIEIPNNNIDEDCDGNVLIIDEDGDGFNSDEDCDDDNADINPNATEIPNNNIDEDCDGEILMIDNDGDGFNSDEDCDDSNADINPSVMEVPYNGLDDDCNEATRDDDIDGDGYNIDEDCDDNNSGVNPGATEIPYNGLDDDCNPDSPDDDLDGDGFGIDEDCDDDNINIYPGAPEIPENDIDEDCNGSDWIITKIDEIKDFEFIIYPNPTRNQVSIGLEPNISYQLEMYNSAGQMLINIKDLNAITSINLSSYPVGTYFIKITTDHDKKSVMQKVIKL